MAKEKRKPTWTPSSLSEVKEEDVLKYFDTTDKKNLPLFHPQGGAKVPCPLSSAFTMHAKDNGKHTRPTRMRRNLDRLYLTNSIPESNS